MSQIRKILIVDDDNELRGGLAEQLALYEEFETSEADSAAAGLHLLRQRTPDLVIMDVGLPDMDGREAAKQARTEGFKGPSLLLGGHVSDSDLVSGIESGANDYVIKPFRFAVLLARIRAHLRQHEAGDEAALKIGPYTFRPSSKYLLHTQGHKIRLTEKETAILRFLARAAACRSTWAKRRFQRR